MFYLTYYVKVLSFYHVTPATFQVLGRHVAKGTCMGWHRSEVSRSPHENVKELLRLWGMLGTGAIECQGALICLILLALLPITFDCSLQPVASFSKNSNDKSDLPDPPVTFTPGAWVSHLLFLHGSRDPPREIEAVSITCSGTPFLQSPKPEYSRVSSFRLVVKMKMSPASVELTLCYLYCYA